MLKYLKEYESVSAARMKSFNLVLGWNLVLLKFLLVFVKLALFN